MSIDFNIEFSETNSSWDAKLNESNQSFNTDFGEVSTDVYSHYTGIYTVTPSSSIQILATANKVCDSNITVNPIPSNYGLITYNGYELTVS